jgi:phosphate:Na+ symporter
MNADFDIWKLLAGIGIFLFGLLLLEDSLKALSGKAFKRMIRSYTSGRLRSIGSGVIVTAVLQSSTAISMMVLAFVGAGIMSMENAIGVIMGSNIGTTLTAWIVATLGFKVKIDAFALPLIAIGGIGMIFFKSSSKLFHVCRHLIGFGFLFLGLDYMKTSVETLAQAFDISQVPDYGLWLYVLIGIILTVLMQSSSASIVVVLTALHSQLIDFDMGAAMVIGANMGTTLTVVLGSLGGIPSKKRVGVSHLIFNGVTGVVAFLGIHSLTGFISLVIDLQNNSVMGLALFHTLFNLLGVLIFFPFIGLLTKTLVKLYPDRKAVLTLYINNTPVEVPEAAAEALRKEVIHLLEECQIHNLRLLKIDEKRAFGIKSFFERETGKRLARADLYETIKLLHAEIFAYYSSLQAQKLEESEAKEQERVIYASRNMMNSIKNFKGIRHNLSEFDASDNTYLNSQYKLFRKRLQGLYRSMNHILEMESKEEQYRALLKSFVHIEENDEQFIRETMKAVADKKIKEMQIASLLLVNRLFTQAGRMQVYGMKDLLLTQEQVEDFDRALDMKEIMDEEKAESGREQK